MDLFCSKCKKAISEAEILFDEIETVIPIKEITTEIIEPLLEKEALKKVPKQDEELLNEAIEIVKLHVDSKSKICPSKHL